MNNLCILQYWKERLAAAVAGHVIPHFDPIAVSPWLAMWLLQKAIRRAVDPRPFRTLT
jgi:hypothetical protein